MKSKTNKRIKRVKKTLRTRRKVKKMRGGVFGGWWKKSEPAKMDTYCAECMKKCNGRPKPSSSTNPTPIFKTQPPSNQPLQTANGWRIEEQSYPDSGEASIWLEHNDLKNVQGEKCTLSQEANQTVYEYRLSIDKLPKPGKYSVIDDPSITVSLICHKGTGTATDKDKLVWVADRTEYPFVILKPLTVVIGSEEKTLVKTES